LITFIFATQYMRTVEHAQTLWRVWLAIAVIAATILLLDPSRWGEKVVNVLAWEHRTTYAYFLSVPTTVLLVQLLNGGLSLPRLLRAGSLVLLLPALFISHSRGAWLTVGIGVGVLLFLGGSRRKAWLYAAICAALIAVALTSVETETALLIRSLFDWSVRSSSLYRFDIYLAGVSAIGETGLWGTGPSSVAGILSQYTLQDYQHLDDDKFATDSDIIWLLVEAGLITVLGLLACVAAYAKTIATWKAGFLLSDYLPFVAAVFFAFLALITLDNILMTPLGWFLLGTIWGGLRIARPNASKRLRGNQ
jgi:hypothetical protein